MNLKCTLSLLCAVAMILVPRPSVAGVMGEAQKERIRELNQALSRVTDWRIPPLWFKWRHLLLESVDVRSLQPYFTAEEIAVLDWRRKIDLLPVLQRSDMKIIDRMGTTRVELMEGMGIPVADLIVMLEETPARLANHVALMKVIVLLEIMTTPQRHQLSWTANTWRQIKNGLFHHAEASEPAPLPDWLFDLRPDRSQLVGRAYDELRERYEQQRTSFKLVMLFFGKFGATKVSTLADALYDFATMELPRSGALGDYQKLLLKTIQREFIPKAIPFTGISVTASPSELQGVLRDLVGARSYWEWKVAMNSEEIGPPRKGESSSDVPCRFDL